MSKTFRLTGSEDRGSWIGDRGWKIENPLKKIEKGNK